MKRRPARPALAGFLLSSEWSGAHRRAGATSSARGHAAMRGPLQVIVVQSLRIIRVKGDPEHHIYICLIYRDLLIYLRPELELG